MHSSAEQLEWSEAREVGVFSIQNGSIQKSTLIPLVKSLVLLPIAVEIVRRHAHINCRLATVDFVAVRGMALGKPISVRPLNPESGSISACCRAC